SNAVLVYYQDGDPSQFLPWPRAAAPAQTFSDYVVRFVVIPGLYPQGYISYPLLPWIGIALWGIAAGYFFCSPLGRNIVGNFSAVMAPVCLVLFVIVRTVGGTFGNLRGWPRGEPSRSENFIIAFFDVSKCEYAPPARWRRARAVVDWPSLT